MNARAVCRDGCGRFAVHAVDIPQIDDTSILIQNKVSLISPGTETHPARLDRGCPGPDKKPRQTGYCCGGIVLECGAKVEGVKPGDSVIAMEWERAFHATHVSVSANMAVKIPEDLPLAEAVFATLSSVGLHAVRRIEAQLGETMVVAGAGLIGQFSAQYARLAGSKVIVMDRVQTRLDIAKKCGADLVLNCENTDTMAAVMEFTNGYGIDTGVIAFGGDGSSVFGQLAEMMCTPPDGQKIGRVCIPGECRITLPAPNIMGNINIYGCSKCGAGYRDSAWHRGLVKYPKGYVRWTARDNYQEALRVIGKETFSVKELITHAIPFEEAPDAYEVLMNEPEKALGVILLYE